MLFLKRLLASLIGPIIVCWLFWVGGFDFNHRGGAAVCCAVLSLGAWASCGCFAMAFIAWKPRRPVRF